MIPTYRILKYHLLLKSICDYTDQVCNLKIYKYSYLKYYFLLMHYSRMKITKGFV